MIATMDIAVTKVEQSKLQDLSLENLPFGKYFSDHMLEADYEDGEWKNVEIKPYQPLLLSPSVAALHLARQFLKELRPIKMIRVKHLFSDRRIILVASIFLQKEWLCR